ncbi:CheR family methyltransferase [Salinibius halmophilus]|uniref:CheR family methyltransferase n=1 Tax=Salinibius halmophilus TaxID=1853216 RepID=UPI000E6732AD|nr:protein-glutamate O-methyltransferase CheR [Salinibius halmophilus]
MANDHITEADFERFRDFFYRKTGIHFDVSKRYFVDKRLQARMAATGHPDFRSYFTELRFNPKNSEIEQLINSMTVNETYFFREQYQFECMTEEVMDELVRNNINMRVPTKSLKIWSIPSSSGEEPYSIAIFLLEHWPGIEEYDVEIISSDIDTAMLAKCKKGIYSERSVQYLPKNIKDKYFKYDALTKFYHLSPDIKNAINFTQVNLADIKQTRSYRNYDLIFCRNLLIYFDDISRRNAAEVFFDALKPGGYIFLGHSESMSRISSLFTVKKFRKAIAYQKPLERGL